MICYHQELYLKRKSSPEILTSNCHRPCVSTTVSLFLSSTTFRETGNVAEIYIRPSSFHQQRHPNILIITMLFHSCCDWFILATYECTSRWTEICLTDWNSNMGIVKFSLNLTCFSSKELFRSWVSAIF